MAASLPVATLQRPPNFSCRSLHLLGLGNSRSRLVHFFNPSLSLAQTQAEQVWRSVGLSLSDCRRRILPDPTSHITSSLGNRSPSNIGSSPYCYELTKAPWRKTLSFQCACSGTSTLLWLLLLSRLLAMASVHFANFPPFAFIDSYMMWMHT